MAKLAIRGHKTRGKEVIEILEMLGGRAEGFRTCRNPEKAYFINSTGGYIQGFNLSLFSLKVTLFTLEEFLEKFPYKVGDKVVHRNSTSCATVYEITRMMWEGVQIKYTLTPMYASVNAEGFEVAENLKLYQSEEEQSKEKETMEKDMNTPEAMKQITDAAEVLVASTSQDAFRISNEDIIDKSKIVFRKDAPDRTELVLGTDFEVVVEDGKTYVVRKQRKYPKTYEECMCKLGLSQSCKESEVIGYKSELLSQFQQLLLCRDAYWKLAGDWKPDWTDINSKKFIICSTQGKLERYSSVINSVLLAFPTAEMRDAFHKNFKEPIDECQELL